MAEYSPLPDEKSPKLKFRRLELLEPWEVHFRVPMLRQHPTRDLFLQVARKTEPYDLLNLEANSLRSTGAFSFKLITGIDDEGRIQTRSLYPTDRVSLESWDGAVHRETARLIDGHLELKRVRQMFPLSSGVISIGAGATYIVAGFAVPTGKTLRVHSIGEVYDPDGYISAELYNITDAVSVVSVDGFDDTGWEIAGGKEVEFRMKNADTVAAHDGHYVFLISLI